MRKKNLYFVILLIMFAPIFSVTAAPKVSCGNVTDIPAKIPELTSYAITVVQISIPVILVIMGSIDLFKGITAQKEDEIKKGQQVFVKRLIYAALIFFVVVIVKLLISIIDNSSNDNISDCIDCFISNDCDSHKNLNDAVNEFHDGVDELIDGINKLIDDVINEMRFEILK